MFKNIIWTLLQISLAHKKSSISRNKDILNTVPTYWFNKNCRFWTFSAQNPSTTKISPLKSFFYLNKSAVFSSHVVLFGLYYLDLLIYCQYNWYKLICAKLSEKLSSSCYLTTIICKESILNLRYIRFCTACIHFSLCSREYQSRKKCIRVKDQCL